MRKIIIGHKDELTEHQVEGALTALRILVTDKPDPLGNANHRYEIIGFSTNTNPSKLQHDNVNSIGILFQNGTIPENGVNGITQEALLAICADRLRSFQDGPFASPDNQEALNHIEKSIECLHRRTRNRLARGIEGQHIV